jgi:Phospholipase_D-nuclease N-terminal
MSRLGTILTALLTLYALVTGVFIISENRRPRSTLAWMLVLLFAPGVGLLIYLFFGRDSKAFSKRRKLLMQDIEANARRLLSAILSSQDAELARLESSTRNRGSDIAFHLFQQIMSTLRSPILVRLCQTTTPAAFHDLNPASPCRVPIRVRASLGINHQLVVTGGGC